MTGWPVDDAARHRLLSDMDLSVLGNIGKTWVYNPGMSPEYVLWT